MIPAAFFLQHASGSVQALAAQLASICAHAPAPPRLYVSTPELDPAARAGLERTCEGFGAALEFASAPAGGADYPLAALECLTATASACGLERAVVVLDDSIFLSGLSPLLELDLQGLMLAAVRDVKLMDNRRTVRALGALVRDLPLPGPQAIFDPTLMVIDCRLWLEGHCMEHLTRQAAVLPAAARRGWCTSPAAAALYRHFGGDYVALPRSWGIPYQYARLFLFEHSLKEGEMRRLRFNGPPGTQPWLDPDAEGAELFYDCLERTPWSTWVPSHRQGSSSSQP